MVSDAYILSPRRAGVVRFAALLFLLVGCVSVAGTALWITQPGLSVRYSSTGYAARTILLDLAPEDARPALAASPSAQEEFARHVARPLVRTGLAGVVLIDDLPFAALMFGVSLALRKLATRAGDDLAGALPWLRRASIAAVLMAVATPVAASLRAMILLPGTPSGPMWYFEADVSQLVSDLLLALAAFAVVWALDAGSRAERDVAAFV